MTLRSWPSFFLTDPPGGVDRTNLSHLHNGHDAVDAFSATLTVVGPYARNGSHLSVHPYLPYTSDLPHGYDHPLALFYTWLRDLPCLTRVTHGVVSVKLNFTVLWTGCDVTVGGPSHGGRVNFDYADFRDCFGDGVSVLAVSPDNPNFTDNVHYPDSATSRFLLNLRSETHEPDPRDTLTDELDDLS